LRPALPRLKKGIMSEDWQNKEAQMRYTAEYMAKEYKNEASNWKWKFNKLADALDDLVKMMPKEQIVWYPDVDEQVKKLEKLIEEERTK
tara:strand:+ start:163 stop:429 length:267 start_codon:yes stop_codon:yes gene_type:complete